MELQQALPEFTARGILPVAISYDPVGVLKAFADTYGIEYPLLSDEGSKVIRSLGLLNEALDRDHGYYGGTAKDYQWGVPYPGHFVLDAEGRVTSKQFLASYRERETGIGMLARAFGVRTFQHGRAAQAHREGVALSAYLDADEYSWFQRLWLTVELTVDPGLHIYGRPVPAGFIPLTVEVAPLEGVTVGQLSGPEPVPFRVAGLAEQFLVHAGRVSFVLPVTITRKEGDIALDVTVRYQACSESDCLIPEAVPFRLQLRAKPPAEKPNLPE